MLKQCAPRTIFKCFASTVSILNHTNVELMEGDHGADLFRFVDKCCLMSSSATMWMELLRLYSAKQLNDLGSVFLRAKSHLSPKEFELLNQRWQMNRVN